MTKPELIAAMMKKGNCSRKDAEKALELVTSLIIDLLTEGEKIHLKGLGIFEIREHKQKIMHNPRTQVRHITPAKKVPTFRAAKSLKDAVNQT